MKLQCDLLELRDAHAKLRTTNEKLRREKERWDRERDDLRQLASAKRRADNDEDRRIQLLLDQVCNFSLVLCVQLIFNSQKLVVLTIFFFFFGINVKG